jgi:uncharacterized membrane protein
MRGEIKPWEGDFWLEPCDPLIAATTTMGYDTVMSILWPIAFAIFGIFLILAAPQISRDTRRGTERGDRALIGNISVTGSRFFGVVLIVGAVALLIAP